MQAPSTLEFALTGLLLAVPLSGYDLRKQFAGSPLRHFSDSPGSVYPALRRLAQRGWISPLPQVEGPRNRQRFAVTEVGRRAFEAWLQAPVTRDDIIRDTKPLFLRFAFMGGTVPRERILDFLGQLERELQAYVDELRSYLANHRPALSASTTGLLAFEHGIEGFELELAWTRRAIAEVGHETFRPVEDSCMRTGVHAGDGVERDARHDVGPEDAQALRDH